MKDEIEKILTEYAWEIQGLGKTGESYNKDDATNDLQKLFLGKQIELLSGIITGNGWAATCKKLRDTITQLQYELKQLQ